jgi:PAS domain S-box-containing protein
MSLSINAYGLISLVAALINLLVGVFVWSQNYKNKVNRTFFVSSFFLFVWGINEALQRLTTDAGSAYFIFIYLVPLGSTFYAASLLYFLNNLIDNKKFNTNLINFFLFLPALFFILLRYLNPQIFATGMVLESWGYSPQLAFFYYYYGAYIGINIILGVVVSVTYALSNKGQKKMAAILIALGTFIAVVSGLFTQIIMPYFNVIVPEMSVASSIFFSSLVAYSVIKYGLMTITPEKAANNILEAIEDFIIVANKDMKIEFVNKSVLLKLHYKKEELTNQPVSKIFRNEVPKLNGSDTAKTPAAYHKDYFQTTIITKEGSFIPVSFENSDIVDRDGRVVGYSIIMRDMRDVNSYIEELVIKTERINLERQKLSDQQKAILNILEDVEAEKEKSKKLADSLKLATESAKIGVFEWDIIKNRLTWDEQTEKIFGNKRKNRNGTIETWFKDNVHPDDRDRVKKEITESLAGKKDFSATYRVVWPDESVHFVKNSSSTKRDDTNKPIKAVGVCWDVTQEMEIDKAKTEFVSLASHQLRTPLSAINWYAEMLIAGDAGKLNKEQKQYINEIYLGNQRMVSLVNALLNVSRLELGTFSVEPEQAQITTIADDVIKELKPQMEKRKIKFSKKYQTKIPQMMLDKKLANIIFQNLLSNAFKYTPEQKSVSLEINTNKKDLLIRVADTGLGIPLSQKDRIFTKLFRADNVRATDTEGTGLGLYIVKSIVDNVGGEIYFTTEENKGTTFNVSIPLSGMKKKEGVKALT